jgi:hypothetical protein
MYRLVGTAAHRIYFAAAAQAGTKARASCLYKNQYRQKNH